MQFDANRAKEAGIDTGAAVVGAVAGLAISNKLSALIAEKSPASTLTRHVPAMLLSATIVAQAFGVVPASPVVDSALQGVAVVTGMQAVREYSGANDAGKVAAGGIAALTNQYVRAFREEGENSVSAATQDAATAMQGLVDYYEPSAVQAAMMSGREQQLLPRPAQLGTTAARPQHVG